WLTSVWIEGNGGGNRGESYALAWYFAAHHTIHDHYERRAQKGILVTIGDEPIHDNYPSEAIRRITGRGDLPDFTAKELHEAANKKYDIHHIYILDGSGQSFKWS